MQAKGLSIESKIVAGYRSRVVYVEQGAELVIERPSLFLGKISVPDNGRDLVDDESAVIAQALKQLGGFGVTLAAVELAALELPAGSYALIGNEPELPVSFPGGPSDDPGYAWMLDVQEMQYMEGARMYWTDGMNPGGWEAYKKIADYPSLGDFLLDLFSSYITATNMVGDVLYMTFDGMHYPQEIEWTNFPAGAKQYLLLEKL